MATTTTNMGLKKPALSDDALISDINDNMDLIDTAAEATSEGIAFVSIGNTHAAISQGKYVYIRRHSTLAEGLYTANSSLAANATLTSSNVTAVPSGGALNALNDQIGNILQNEKLLDASSLNTTATSYNLTKEFTKYVMVSLLLKYQGIYIDCITIPASIFNTTSSTNYVRLLSGDVEVHMYKNTTSAIYAFSSTTTSNLKIEMIGFIKNS